MATALTVYCTDAISAIVAGGQLVEVGAGTTTIKGTVANTGVFNPSYGELWALGTLNAWPAAASEPAPSGNGWCDDGITLYNQEILAGVWTPSIKLGTDVGSIVADVHMRVSHRSASGVYTVIGDMVAAAQTIGATAANITAFTGTSLPLISFLTNEHLYVDAFLNITSEASSPTKAKITEGVSAGITNSSLVTPGYQPIPVINPSQPMVRLRMAAGRFV